MQLLTNSVSAHKTYFFPSVVRVKIVPYLCGFSLRLAVLFFLASVSCFSTIHPHHQTRRQPNNKVEIFVQDGSSVVLQDRQGPPSPLRGRSPVRQLPFCPHRPLSKSVFSCSSRCEHPANGGIFFSAVTLSSSSLASMVCATSARCGACCSPSPRFVVLPGKSPPSLCVPFVFRCMSVQKFVFVFVGALRGTNKYSLMASLLTDCSRFPRQQSAPDARREGPQAPLRG